MILVVGTVEVIHEEPIVYDNLEGYARLTADLKTPVQIGQNFYGPRALYTALQMKDSDYVMPDFMRIGSVTGWQRAAAIAGAAGIPISTPEVAAHVMRVSETAHWLEWPDWTNPILQRPYEVTDGNLHVPDVPGVGLEWDEKAVAAHDLAERTGHPPSVPLVRTQVLEERVVLVLREICPDADIVLAGDADHVVNRRDIILNRCGDVLRSK